MNLLKRFLIGCLYGLGFSGAWFLAEGLYVAVRVPEVPWWSFAFDLGVAAPLVLVATVVSGAVSLAWSAALGCDDPVGYMLSKARRWLWDDPPAAHATRISWILTAVVLFGAWLAACVWSGNQILGTVKTAEFAAALIVLVGLGSAGMLALGSAVFAVPGARLVGWLGRVGNKRWLKTAYAVVGLVVAAVAALIALWQTFPDVLPHLPWNFVLSALLSLLVIIGLAMASRRFRRFVPTTVAILAGVVAALGAFAVYLPQSLAEGRAVFSGRTTVASVWYGALEKRLDYDGDGAVHLYGGNDCAPHDAARNPFARDIVGNGVDENCSGADLTVDMAEFSSGEAHHSKPSGIVDRPNIILVTTDSLSYRHTTVGGYKRDVTPNLAKWAKDATVFDEAFSLAPSTRLAFPGIVAGTFNSAVPMLEGRIHPYEYAKEVTTVAEMLQRRGYKTIFVPGDKLFLPRVWRGYTQGFDVVDASGYKTAKDKAHTAPAVTRRVLAHLREHDGGQPLFLWVHFFDHHTPYDEVDGHSVFEGTTSVDRYDNELHFADVYWAKIFEAVQRKWRPDEYVMAFTSDHGEAFDARHPNHHHGYDLDTEVLHVPFIIQGPKERGKHVGGLVSHADLATTFANLVGARPPKEWIGESLTPVLFDDKQPEKGVVYSLFYLPEASKEGEDGFNKIAVRTDDYAYQESLAGNKRLLFDWKQDPLGEHDLHKKQPDTLEIYRYLAAKKLEELRGEERALSFLNRPAKAKKNPKKHQDAKKTKKAKGSTRTLKPKMLVR